MITNNKLIVWLSCAILSITIISCGEKLHTAIGYVKNNTSDTLVGANWYRNMTDSVLCNDRIYLNYYLQPHLSESLATGGNVNLSSESDSSKEYIYIFNEDSLNKYQKLKICSGIVKHCIVKKIEIQLNKVKDPMDTVFINSSNH